MKKENEKFIYIHINSKMFDIFIEHNNLILESNKKSMEILLDYIMKNNLIVKYKNTDIHSKNIIKEIGVRCGINENNYNAIKNYNKQSNLGVSNIINKTLYAIIIKEYNLIIDMDGIVRNNKITYPDEIKNYILDKDILSNIKNLCSKENTIKPYFIEENINKIIDFYYKLYLMRYVFKYSPKQINECYKNITSIREIQMILKSVEWQFDISESQQYAAKERNYFSIRNKGKNTIMENYYAHDDKGSEGYIRIKINLMLHELFDINDEIIVGLNSFLIDEKGKEIDVPIIIIHNNQLYKFGIEINGDLWHEKERDKSKYSKALDNGYKIFYILVCGNSRIQREEYGEIDDQIVDVCKSIKDLVI